MGAFTSKFYAINMKHQIYLWGETFFSTAIFIGLINKRSNNLRFWNDSSKVFYYIIFFTFFCDACVFVCRCLIYNGYKWICLKRKKMWWKLRRKNHISVNKKSYSITQLNWNNEFVFMKIYWSHKRFVQYVDLNSSWIGPFSENFTENLITLYFVKITFTLNFKSRILQRKKSMQKFFYATISIRKPDNLIIKFGAMLRFLLIEPLFLPLPSQKDANMQECATRIKFMSDSWKMTTTMIFEFYFQVSDDNKQWSSTASRQVRSRLKLK